MLEAGARGPALQRRNGSRASLLGSDLRLRRRLAGRLRRWWWPAGRAAGRREVAASGGQGAAQPRRVFGPAPRSRRNKYTVLRTPEYARSGIEYQLDSPTTKTSTVRLPFSRFVGVRNGRRERARATGATWSGSGSASTRSATSPAKRQENSTLA